MSPEQTNNDDVEILVVDDRPQDLMAIEGILSSRDYNLSTAQTGAEALRKVLERDFAVILLDVMMPDMDGFELATIIKQRERSRHTPIIFMTAAGADLSFIYRAYSVGAVDYLGKPIDADVFKAKVGIFVDLFRKDRRIKQQAEALRAADRRERDLELAELQLANERRYRNLAEAIPQIVWTAAPDGAVTYFNQRWFEYTGQTTDEAHASGWMAAVHPDEAVRYEQQWREALASSQVLELEVRLRGRDGEFRWHLCRAVPERGDFGQVVAWLGTYTDFDDRKRALDAAQAAVHARDEFLSIASHELRTPLTTLQLRLQSLEHHLGDVFADGRESLRYKLTSAMGQGRRLISLVDNLLDVARITNGKLTLQKERFDLGEAVRDVTEHFSELASGAGCSLELTVEDSVAGTWDRLRVEQIVGNLISNAIKYAPKAAINVAVAGTPSLATVSVRDHGMGIAADDVHRVFGQFERAVSARQYGGLGMGLYIARQIALAHGGTIEVASTPGDGSTFLLQLPRS